jgi:hypothetical protein
MRIQRQRLFTASIIPTRLLSTSTRFTAGVRLARRRFNAVLNPPEGTKPKVFPTSKSASFPASRLVFAKSSTLIGQSRLKNRKIIQQSYELIAAMAWLKAGLDTSTAPVKLILSSSQVLTSKGD